MEIIEERLARLKHEIERMKAVTEIQNVIGRYQSLHKPMTMYLTPEETFALTMPDVSMEVSDWGVFVGPDAVRYQFGEMMKEELIGCMFDHYVCTPIIEVAGDGKTARAKFDSPGHETQIDGKSGHKAFWCWGSYSAEFIKEPDGKWKIWHLKWWRTFRTEFYKSWVDDWQNIMTGPAHEHDWPAEPCTFFHPYDTKTERWPFPLPPEPYENYEGTMLDWAFGGEKYKWIKEAYLKKYGTPTGAFEYAHGRKPGVIVNNPSAIRKQKD